MFFPVITRWESNQSDFYLTAMASRSFAVFLEQINLEKYYENFDSHGYDTVFDLCLLEDKDLDSLNIVDPEDRAKILEEGKNLRRMYIIEFLWDTCFDV